MSNMRRLSYEMFPDAEVVDVFGRRCRLVYIIPVDVDDDDDDFWLLPEYTVGILVYVGGCFVATTRSDVVSTWKQHGGLSSGLHMVMCIGIDADDVGWLVTDLMVLGCFDALHRTERWQPMTLPYVWSNVLRIVKMGLRDKWLCSELSLRLLTGVPDGGRDVVGGSHEFGLFGRCQNTISFVNCAGAFLSNAGLRCYVACVYENIGEFVCKSLSDGYVVSVEVSGGVRFPLGSALPSEENDECWCPDRNHRFTLFPVAGIERRLFVDSYHFAWYDESEIVSVVSQSYSKRGLVIVMTPASHLSVDCSSEV